MCAGALSDCLGLQCDVQTRAQIRISGADRNWITGYFLRNGVVYFSKTRVGVGVGLDLKFLILFPNFLKFGIFVRVEVDPILSFVDKQVADPQSYFLKLSRIGYRRLRPTLIWLDHIIHQRLARSLIRNRSESGYIFEAGFEFLGKTDVKADSVYMV